MATFSIFCMCVCDALIRVSKREPFRCDAVTEHSFKVMLFFFYFSAKRVLVNKLIEERVEYIINVDSSLFSLPTIKYYLNVFYNNK